MDAPVVPLSSDDVRWMAVDVTVCRAGIDSLGADYLSAEVV